LDINDQVVCAADEELVELALTVAAGHQKDLVSIAEWFRQRTMPFGVIRQATWDGELLNLLNVLPGDYELWQRPLLHATVVEAEKELYS